jgi:hypothetical protein
MTRNFTTLPKLAFAAFAQRKSRLEIGHVPFIDIAGYSKLTTEEESETVGRPGVGGISFGFPGGRYAYPSYYNYYPCGYHRRP